MIFYVVIQNDIYCNVIWYDMMRDNIRISYNLIRYMMRDNTVISYDMLIYVMT